MLGSTFVELRAGYQSRLPGHVRALEEMVERRDGSQVRDLAHKLRGSGGTYGFPSISCAAGAVELASQGELWARAAILVQTLRAAVRHAIFSPTRRESVQPAPPTVPPRARVLLVDDDREICGLVAARLEASGYGVASFHTGRPALEAFECGQFDLCILDVRLPDLSGLELLKRIRANSSTPVMMLTSLGREDNVVHAFGLGADEYVVKPFRPRELMARISRLLGGASRAERPKGCLSGSFEGDQLLEVLQMLSAANKTGRLRVEAGSEQGHLELAEGRLVQAVGPAGEHDLRAAAQAVLALEEGRFEFVPGPGETSLPGLSVSALLLDVARRRDEAGQVVSA